MKSLIKKILKEETQKRTLGDVIFDDLVETFNDDYISNLNYLTIKMDEVISNQFGTIHSLLMREVLPHINNTYSLLPSKDKEIVLPIVTKFVRHLYKDEYPMPGDVIEMVEMEGDDPNPILPGTKGVVEDIRTVSFGSVTEEHVIVKWENGRNLKVLLPHDKIKVIERNNLNLKIPQRWGSRKLSENKIDDFVDFAKVDLDLDNDFTVDITNDSEDVETLASYDMINKKVTVLGKNRSLPDIIRSVAHELVHHKQNERGELNGREEEGENGSPWEDQANAKAGEMVRSFGDDNPDIYDLG